jgi:hypothetical protein
MNQTKKYEISGWLFAILISVLIFIEWYPALNIPFLNDDFQILGYFAPHSFFDCFKPFWSQDISATYWRPLVNSLNALTIYFFGFVPFPFHLTNLLIYISDCFLLGLFLKKIGLQGYVPFLAAVLYAILPSHELQVAWIPCRDDSLAFLFIFLFLLFYIKSIKETKKKNNYLPYLFFVAAILSKEAIYPIIFVPFLFLLLQIDEKFNFRKALNSSLILLTIILSSLGFRYFIIGGSPFSSYIFNKIDILSMPKNLILYLSTSFLRPDSLEFLADKYITNIYFMIISSILILFIVWLLIANFMLSSTNSRKILIFGILWFSIFISPALPVFMRWYSFTASIGLIISFASLIDEKGKKVPQYLMKGLLFFMIWVLADCFGQMDRWVSTGEKTQKILLSLRELNLNECSTITIWAAPDKIDKINSMKLGIEQAVHWATGNKKLNVIVPMKIECWLNTKVSVTKLADNEYLFKADYSRFLTDGMKSKSVIKAETGGKATDEYNLQIEIPYPAKDRTAKAHLKFYSCRMNNIHLYFDGDKFSKLE